MTTLIWFTATFLSGLILITFVPVIAYFNPIAGIVFGFIFFRLFLLSFSCLRDYRNAIRWAEQASNSPLLNNDPQNITTLPAHPLNDQYLGK